MVLSVYYVSFFRPAGRKNAGALWATKNETASASESPSRCTLLNSQFAQRAPDSQFSHMHTLFATLQLADSFFPTGMFTQSHGLESFVAAGTVGAAQIEALL